MPKIVDGTEGLGGGAYEKPLGTDNGADSAQVIREFIARMAIHTHNGDNALVATLPTKTEESSTPTFSAIEPTTGLYDATLVFTRISNLPDATIAFYYRELTDSDDPENWTQFHPSYDIISGTSIKIYTMRNDIRVKVVA